MLQCPAHGLQVQLSCRHRLKFGEFSLSQCCFCCQDSLSVHRQEEGKGCLRGTLLSRPFASLRLKFLLDYGVPFFLGLLCLIFQKLFLFLCLWEFHYISWEVLCFQL